MALTNYAIVVLGSNNATYGTAAADAIEAFVRGSGGLLVVGDTNFGSTWSDAAASDNAFLSRFGLSFLQEFGTYTLARASGDFATPLHPALLGVDEIAGETVAPVRLGAVPADLAVSVLARAEVQVRNHDGSPGTLRPADANDIAALAASLERGKIAVFFDRDAFVNEKIEPATSLVAGDNLDFAANLFDWLAVRRDGVLLTDGFEEPVP